MTFDGRSLLPLWEDPAAAWPERTYFVQSHRGNAPEPYRAFAAVEQRYKLVQALSFSQPAPPDAPLELYDLVEDPGETTDIAARRPDIVERQPLGFAKGSIRAPSEPPPLE